MALFGTNAEVRSFNEAVIERLSLQSVVVEAQDTLMSRDRSTKSGGIKKLNKHVFIIIIRGPIC